MLANLRASAFAAFGLFWAGAAYAQLPDRPYVAAGGRLTLAGEVSATAGPRDSEAYFNFTDYGHDSLRTVRARLLGEWRAAAHVSVLGELRVENKDSITAAALYLRWRPWTHRALDLQVGRIPPVIGAFARRAYGRDNLVIGVPLAYQYLTSLRPDALPSTADDLLRMRARGWRPSFPIGSHEIATGVPLVSAFEWATGAEAHGQVGRFDLAAAVTRGAPAFPAPINAPGGPAVSGRIGAEAGLGFTLGASAASGRWIDRSVLSAVPERQRDRSSQSVVGADLEYSHARLLVRAEWLRSAFDIPSSAAPEIRSPLVANSGFLEGRYRWHPRWQGAVRAERLTFSRIRGTLFEAAATPWDAPVTRVEATLGFRAARNLELRAGWQHDRRQGGRIRVRSYPAAQVLYWF